MNMKSKYIVLATTLLLLLSSSVSLVSAAHPQIKCPTGVANFGMATVTKGELCPSQVDTHGPRLTAIDFSVIAQDGPLALALGSGSIQMAEWTFTVGSYNTLLKNTNVELGTTLGYTFEGIAFNTIAPIISSIHYRMAIQYLTNYATIQNTVCSGVACYASPYLLPCKLYPASTCYSGGPTEAYNLLQAAVQLAMSGVTVKGNTTNITPACAASKTCAKTLKQELSGLMWFYPCTLPFVHSCSKPPAFNPLFYYRSDDPLRAQSAIDLIKAALGIGLVFTAHGTQGSYTSAVIYGPAAEATIRTGGYCSGTTFNDTDTNPHGVIVPVTKGSNECPVAKVNATMAWPGQVDSWDMYTYGWVASSMFTTQAGYLFNSAFAGYPNFGQYINNASDVLQNNALYGTTMAGAEAAAKTFAHSFASSLPYVMWFYESYMFGNYIKGWAGYAAEPTTGPDTVGGAYYTFLNVHPTCTGSASVHLPHNEGYCKDNLGGAIQYALHQAPDTGGLNPIYYSNWVWQADIWSEIYDGPLATPPTQFQIPAAIYNFQLTSHSTSAFSGPVPAGAFNTQNSNHAPITISGGELISFTFAKNITFSDGIPLTAYDYNFSLYALQVALPPTLSNVETPYYGLAAGPLGLLATTVTNGGYTINMYMGSNLPLNILDVSVPVLPQHIFQYFDLNNAFAAESNIDFTGTYAAEVAAFPSSVTGLSDVTGLPVVAPAPASVQYLCNLEVGSGPFYLYYYNGATGAGILNANPTYFRSAWYDNLTANTFKGTTTHNFYATSKECIYNAGGAPFDGIAPGSYGVVQDNPTMLAASNVLAGYSGPGADGTMTCVNTIQQYTGGIASGGNQYSGHPTGPVYSIPCTVQPNGQNKEVIHPAAQVVYKSGNSGPTKTVVLPKGNYKMTWIHTFYKFGVLRTWIQVSGFTTTTP